MSKHEDAVIAKIAERVKLGLNKLYAGLFGYFWLPCPVCGRMFGGHQVARSHGATVIKDGRAMIVCPRNECGVTARLNILIESGTKAWANVPDGWLEDLRGDVPKGPEL